jgi:hypothetical protein
MKRNPDQSTPKPPNRLGPFSVSLLCTPALPVQRFWKSTIGYYVYKPLEKAALRESPSESPRQKRRKLRVSTGTNNKGL